MTTYNIVAAAEAIVENEIELVRAIYEARQLQVKEASRIVCRCPSCRREIERALDWTAAVGEIAAAGEQPALAPHVVAHRVRVFPSDPSVI